MSEKTLTYEEKTLSLQIPCDLKQVREVRRFFKEFIEGLPFSDEDQMNLELALNEGVSNAIDHGSANNKKMIVDITFEIKRSFLIIIIKDYGGKEFNPEYYERITLKKDWGRGGRGIYLMRTIMDELSYIFSPNHYTTLYMSKKITNKK